MAVFMEQASNAYLLKRIVDEKKLDAKADEMIRTRSEQAELKLAESYKSQNEKYLDDKFDITYDKLAEMRRETEGTDCTEECLKKVDPILRNDNRRLINRLEVFKFRCGNRADRTHCLFSKMRPVGFKDIRTVSP